MDGDGTVSVKEYAMMVGSSEEAVRKKAQRGTLPAVKRGGRLRILVAPPGDNAPASGVPSEDTKQDARDTEVAYLREELRRAYDRLDRVLSQLDREGRQRDALIEALGTLTVELGQLKFAALPPPPAEETPLSPQLPAPSVGGEVIDVSPPPPHRRPWWLRWRH